MIESLIGSLTSASLRFKWVVIALAVLVMVGGVFAVTQFKDVQPAQSTGAGSGHREGVVKPALSSASRS